MYRRLFQQSSRRQYIHHRAGEVGSLLPPNILAKEALPMTGADYKYFSNRDCQYYPCHAQADPEAINCLFCYCPLYALGQDCGGNYSYTERGIKDCSGCLLPHGPRGYDYILERFPDVADLARRR